MIIGPPFANSVANSIIGAIAGSQSNSGSGGAGLTSYLGQVATRTYLPDDVNTTNKQMRGRSAHIAMDNIVNPTLIFPNFYVDGFGAGATYAELGPGGSATITASIEYPSGTFTQITFAGSSSGTIANISTIVANCTITIPKWSQFFVRFFIQNSGGVVFNLGLGGASPPSINVPGNYPIGDILEAAVSGLTDNTMGGAYTTTSGTNRYSPMIIAAQTTLPSVLVIGNSKVYGEDDTGDATGDIGEVQRWLSPYFANASWGIRGRDAGQFVANSTIQTSFNAYFTHMINEDGINGFIHGQTAATVATNTQALVALFPSLKCFVTTILPVSTSTDNYATLANQTTITYNSGRVTENDRRRTVPSPWLGCFDSASALESSLDSGLVATQASSAGTLNYFNSSISNVHPVRQGYVRIAEFNRANAASSINRDGNPLSFSGQVFINQYDHAEDATSQTTYTWSAKNFIIGTANNFRLVVVGINSRLGTTAATLNSVTIGGVAATKINEALNTTGSALTIQSIWYAVVPTGNTATVSATFSTAMLRAGCDLWTAVGALAIPTIGPSANNSGAANVATISAITVPSRSGAIFFSSTVNGTAPTVTQTGVNILPVTLVGGTMYYASSQQNLPGSTVFTATYNAGASTTGVVVSFSP